MNWFQELLSNPFLLIGLSSWFWAQLIKTIIHAIVTKSIDFTRLIGAVNKKRHVLSLGGPFDGRFGYDYWKTIAQDCFGIPTVKLLEAENLDIVGADAEKIVDDAIKAYGPA